MKKPLSAVNVAFVAAMLLAPAGIFACYTGSSTGIVVIDASAAGKASESDAKQVSSTDATYIHGYNLRDSVGTFTVDGDSGRAIEGGAWHGQKAKDGNGFDFTAGPFKLPAGSHDVEVHSPSGLDSSMAHRAVDVADAGAGANLKGTNGNSAGGGGNFGDVYLHTAGNCADVNAEFLNHGGVCNEPPTADETATPRHTPHLPCADIELMGSKMRDASGQYAIDLLAPSTPDGGNGVGPQVYLSPAQLAQWHYDQAAGAADRQVMDVINVATLIQNAVAAGAEQHPIQGYHFKLQLVQAPQKHKTFWVHCNPPPGSPSPVVNPSGSPSPEASPTPRGTPEPEGSPTPKGTPSPEATPSPKASPSPGGEGGGSGTDRPALHITKSVTPEGTVTAPSTLTYTIHVSNTGSAPANHVAVEDVITATAAYQALDGSQGTPNSFALPSGSTVTRVNAGDYLWEISSPSRCRRREPRLQRHRDGRGFDQ